MFDDEHPSRGANQTGSRRALIVRGGWDGHQPVETTDSVIPFLEGAGFDVRVEDSSDVYADQAILAATDLIVQSNTMDTIEQDALFGLIAAVRAGTGFAGWHGGIADSYRSSTEYLQLVGGQFADHPARPLAERLGDGTDNDLVHTIDIVPAQAAHPIVAGIDDFTLDTEQYWVLTDDYNDVLATTTIAARPDDPWSRPIVCPAVWTRRWGAGRVFVATPGHDLDDLAHPSLRTIIERGLVWASR
ncbi:ThuA domain-containing protein [Plantibacter sp. Mn2098]|uniref:ThuA domain-containing protein n=1 Tax=Plantibacter sp. Mn2098 TaxID=3395266 RepID=UPI003BE53B3D